MKKTALFLSILLVASFMQAQDIKIDPAFWWSGLEETELQLMVYGESIADYTPEITSSHVRIKEVVHLESPNYQLIYLDISKSIPESSISSL